MDPWALCDLETPRCVQVVATLRVADHIAAGKTEIGQLLVARYCLVPAGVFAGAGGFAGPFTLAFSAAHLAIKAV